jgi:UDP-glucose 4-epimerase
MARCLVVGGGFLGSNLALRLCSGGHEVVVFSRSFGGVLGGGDARAPAPTLVRGEVPTDPALACDRLVALLDAAELVFYVAGESTVELAADRSGSSRTDHVQPLAAVLELMRFTDAGRIVVASSGGSVYGNPSVVPTPEDAPLRPISNHGRNVRELERIAADAAEKHGLEPVTLRYANPYGPGQRLRAGHGVVAAWLDALARERAGTVVGDGSTKRDFVFIDDAVAATIAAAFGPRGPVTYNVGSGESVSISDLRAVIERVTGRSGELRRAAARSDDPPVIELDCTKLRLATGWAPTTSLSDGIASTWSWTVNRLHADVRA